MTAHDAPAWYSRLTRASHDMRRAGTYAAFVLEIPKEPETDAPARDVEARARGSKAAAIELAAAAALVERFDRADSAEAVPPALMATDALNIALDREVRDRVRGLERALVVVA